MQSDLAKAEVEAAEKRRWSFLEVDEARDEETNQAGPATQVGYYAPSFKAHFQPLLLLCCVPISSRLPGFDDLKAQYNPL